MGLFDILTGGKVATKGRALNQYELGSMIASTIDGVFTEFGPQKLFDNNCQIIIDDRRNVSAFWGDDPEKMPRYKSSVRLADLDEMDSIKNILSWDMYKGFPPDEATKLVGAVWETMGHEMVDRLATAVLRRL